jgi:hypothetical protein
MLFIPSSVDRSQPHVDMVPGDNDLHSRRQRLQGSQTFGLEEQPMLAADQEIKVTTSVELQQKWWQEFQTCSQIPHWRKIKRS